MYSRDERIETGSINCPCLANQIEGKFIQPKYRESSCGGNETLVLRTHSSVSSKLFLGIYIFYKMSDALFDDECDVNQDDSQDDVMTPAELIAKLEEVSRHGRGCLVWQRQQSVRIFCY